MGLRKVPDLLEKFFHPQAKFEVTGPAEDFQHSGSQILGLNPPLPLLLSPLASLLNLLRLDLFLLEIVFFLGKFGKENALFLSELFCELWLGVMGEDVEGETEVGQAVRPFPFGIRLLEFSLDLSFLSLRGVVLFAHALVLPQNRLDMVVVVLHENHFVREGFKKVLKLREPELLEVKLLVEMRLQQKRKLG